MSRNNNRQNAIKKIIETCENNKKDNLEMNYLVLTKIPSLITNSFILISNLKSLTFISNEINDISSLENLVNLEVISFSNNNISDISFLSKLTKLKNISFDKNNIFDISPLKFLSKLQIIDLSCNQIEDISPLNKLTNLRVLNIDNNNISDISSLNNLIKLRTLDINNNNISDISSLNNLIKLIELNLSYNQISNISSLENLTQLELLLINNNNISNISHLQNLTNLLQLNFSHNNINNIFELRNLNNLERLDIYNNQITLLPEFLTTFHDLRIFYFNGNPIENNRVANHFNNPRIVNNQNIYNDTQNVHNSEIQNSMNNSIKYILSIAPTLTINQMKHNLRDNNSITEKSKILINNYFNNNDIHSIFNITFIELFLYVYCIILKNKDKDEIFKILNNEILESEEKCFTGRIGRLVNCLNGFDENIKINISISEQISNIISQILKSNKSNPKEEIIKELKDRGFSDEEINEWIIHLE